MAQVLVRGLDPDVVEALKARAQANGRSLEAELRTVIERAAGTNIVGTRELAARIRRRLAGRSHSDSAALISEDRER
jgi:plasmid stability protein